MPNSGLLYKQTFDLNDPEISEDVFEFLSDKIGVKWTEEEDDQLRHASYDDIVSAFNSRQKMYRVDYIDGGGESGMGDEEDDYWEDEDLVTIEVFKEKDAISETKQKKLQENNMKKITDDTLVKVKVPRHLYESIKSKMALKEAQMGMVQVEISFQDKEDQSNFEQTYGFSPSTSNYVQGQVSASEVPDVIDTLSNVYGISVKIVNSASREGLAEKKKEEDEKEEKPKYAGTKMSKSAVMDKVGRSRTKTIRGDKAKAYTPVHAMAKEGEEPIHEDVMSLQDILNAVKELQTSDVAMVLTALGSVLGAKKVARNVTQGGSDISGITGAKHG